MQFLIYLYFDSEPIYYLMIRGVSKKNYFLWESKWSYGGVVWCTNLVSPNAHACSPPSACRSCQPLADRRWERKCNWVPWNFIFWKNRKTWTTLLHSILCKAWRFPSRNDPQDWTGTKQWALHRSWTYRVVESQTKIGFGENISSKNIWNKNAGVARFYAVLLFVPITWLTMRVIRWTLSTSSVFCQRFYAGRHVGLKVATQF